MVKMTFTLDDVTVARLRRTAAALDKPQSAVVRDAIAEYAASSGRLGDQERRRLLGLLDTLAAAPPTRSMTAVRAELQAVRAARRRGGRRSRAGR